MRRAMRTPTPSPSRSSTAPERRGRRWLLLALLAGIACRGQAAPHVRNDLKATTATDRVRVFLIQHQGDGGPQRLVDQGGRPVACGDRADRVIPVEITLPQHTPALQGAVAGLLALNEADKEAYDPRSGLYNALYASPLTVDRIERRGTDAAVYLKGYLEVDDGCDGERALAQLTATVLQFPDVKGAQFYLEGKPLREALAGSAGP